MGTKKSHDIDNDYMNYITEKLQNDFKNIFENNNIENIENINLPSDWEKHEDESGPYYWHIPSGTIQRNVPEVNTANNNNTKKDKIVVPRSCTSSSINQDAIDEKRRKNELLYKRRSVPVCPDFECKDKSIRFAVRSLGWIEMTENDLTPENSSKAVNKCIVDLSMGRKNDILDNVGRWGHGKDLYLDLDEGSLKLIDPENLTVFNTQPIHTIRVWGVGRDNGRDFAYVARDRNTRKHMCHVFRCDVSARIIANTLRDICKKVMIERSLHENLWRAQNSHDARPTNLPLPDTERNVRNQFPIASNSFPTPMDEPKKLLTAQYLGSTQVPQATGIEIVHDAIEYLTCTIRQDQWQNVNVAIAPSTISVFKTQNNELLFECRVRYLSFFGIGNDIKHCAFIMHTAQDLFIAHVFHCEDSAGPLCKTIEAACKLRFQKCLDARPDFETGRVKLDESSPNTLEDDQIRRESEPKNFKKAIKGLLNTIINH